MSTDFQTFSRNAKPKKLLVWRATVFFRFSSFFERMGEKISELLILIQTDSDVENLYSKNI